LRDFYDLRHTHASLLIEEGVHAKKIAERLGHGSIKLTMDTCGHVFEGSDRESAERMDHLFGANKADAADTPNPANATAANVVMMPGKISGHADKNADKNSKREIPTPVSA
jgi:hypothetical protein